MTGHTDARDWLAAELRRHGLAPAVIRAVLGGADTYAARASASAVAAERERLRTPPDLPPKWHGADYAERRIENILNRDYRSVPETLQADIDWLLEEIDWLGQQLAAIRDQS